MATHTFNRPHHLNKLHEELLAAIPALAPQNGRAIMQISGGRTNEIVISVPDNITQAQLQAVVSAHRKADGDAADTAREAARVSLRALGAKARAGNATPAEMQQLLGEIAQRVLG